MCGARIRVVLIVLAAASTASVACTDAPQPAPATRMDTAVRPPVVAAPATAAPASDPSLDAPPAPDSQREATAIATAGGDVMRRGDTLFLRRADTGFVTRINARDDTSNTYYYSGRIIGAGGHVLYLLDLTDWDGFPRRVAVDARTGENVNIGTTPQLSPDSTRLLEFMGGNDPCDGARGGIVIWHFGTGTPTREFSQLSVSCVAPQGWIPVAANWQSTDTVRFARVTLHGNDRRTAPLGRDTTTGFVTRDSAGWRYDKASRAELPPR